MSARDWFKWSKKEKPQSNPTEATSPSPAPHSPGADKKGESFHSVEKQIFEQMGIPYKDIVILRDKLRINITHQHLEETHKKLNRFLEYEGFNFRVDYLEIFRSLLLHYQLNEGRAKNLLKPLSFYDVILNRHCEERLKEIHEMDPTSEEVAEMVADIIEEAAKQKAIKLCKAETEHQLRKEYRIPRGEELNVTKEIYQERFDIIWKDYWKKKQEKEGRRPIRE